ncbi:MAG: hypothetical protein AAGF73_06925 [Actinomycetota bacterium]
MKKTIAALATAALASLGAVSVAPSASATDGGNGPAVDCVVEEAPAYNVTGGGGEGEMFIDGEETEFLFDVVGGELNADGGGYIQTSEGTLEVSFWSLGGCNMFMRGEFNGIPMFGTLIGGGSFFQGGLESTWPPAELEFEALRVEAK